MAPRHDHYYESHRITAGLDRELRVSSAPLRIVDERLNKESYPVTPEIPAVIFDEFARATKTYRAVLLLVSRGYGQQAEAQARGLFESFLVSHWAIRNPSLADEYVKLHALFGWELHRQARVASGLWPKTTRKPLLDNTQRDRATMLFGRKCSSYWTGHRNIEALVEDVARASSPDEAEQYRTVYRTITTFGNRLVHSTGISTQSHRKVATDNETLWTVSGPSEHNLQDALTSAGISYLFHLHSFTEAVNPQLINLVEDCGRFMWRSRHDEKKLESLNDADTCPCDKRATIWGDCHKSTDGAELRLQEESLLD